jgi:N-acetylmuramoyl-L-alanine amidase
VQALIFFLAAAGYSLSAQSLSLDDALKALGSSGLDQAELRWDPFFESGVFSSNGHYAAFVSGSSGETGPVLFDNREILSLPLPYRDQGTLWFPSSFVSQMKAVFDRYAEDDRNRFRIAAIIVDPGHGGKDTGAVGEHVIDGKPLKSVEKDITLKVSRFLHSRLAAAFPDKRVLLTREGDTYPTLEDRVALANAVPLRDNEAVIYISIHANASFNKQARGYEVWYLSPGYRRELIDPSRYADSREVIPILNSMMEEEFTTESILMAQSILRNFQETLGSAMPSRGLKEEEWFVVRNARMPSVLVELGFVTNEADARLMNDDGYLKNLSDALYKGITGFVALFERSGGFTAVQ